MPRRKSQPWSYQEAFGQFANRLQSPPAVEKAAKRGDPFALFEAIAQTQPQFLTISFEMARLQQVLLQASKDDPLGFARKMMERGFGMVSYLAMRIELYLTKTMTTADKPWDGENGMKLCPEIFTQLLPQFMEINRHLAEMAAARATVERQIELTRAKKIENDLAEGLRPRKLGMAGLFMNSEPTVVNGRANGINGSSANDQHAETDIMAAGDETYRNPVNRVAGLA